MYINNITHFNSFLYKIYFFFGKKSVLFLGLLFVLITDFMFTKENGKKLVIVAVGCLIALALHQKFIAPRLAPKPKA